jgi:hypothetical protein
MDYGARARAGGTCLVAVLHAASVIGCWGRAAGAASLRVLDTILDPILDGESGTPDPLRYLTEYAGGFEFRYNLGRSRSL